MNDSVSRLINQKLDGFFVEKDENGTIINIVFAFEEDELVVGWDKKLDTFKFSLSKK